MTASVELPQHRASGRRLPVRPAHRAARPRHHVRPPGRRPAGRADPAAAARLGRQRRPQLVPGRSSRSREHFNIVAPDLRGHARGLRTRRVFRLADCADDCAATLVELGTGPVIAVGLLDGRPGRAAALAPPPRPRRRARAVRDQRRLHAEPLHAQPRTRRRCSARPRWRGSRGRHRLLPPVPDGERCRPSTMPAWAAREMRRHDWRMIIEAGHSISTYNARRWIGEVDVPTAVVCTTEDRGVAPSTAARDSPRRSPARPCTQSPTGISPAPTRGSPTRSLAACLDVAGRGHLTSAATPSAPRSPRPTSAAVPGAPTARAPSRAPCERNESKSANANMMWPTMTKIRRDERTSRARTSRRCARVGERLEPAHDRARRQHDDDRRRRRTSR